MKINGILYASLAIASAILWGAVAWSMPPAFQPQILSVLVAQMVLFLTVYLFSRRDSRKDRRRGRARRST